MIFLSDGECSVPDTAIQDVCRSAVRLGCVTFFPVKCIADFAQEIHYLFIPSPLARILLPLPSAGWPMWLSESRTMPLAIP